MNTLKPVETQMKRCLQRFCIYHEQLVCALTELVKERIQLEKKVDWNRTGSGNPYRITKRHVKSSTFAFILNCQVNQAKWPHLLCGVVTGNAQPACASNFWREIDNKTFHEIELSSIDLDQRRSASCKRCGACFLSLFSVLLKEWFIKQKLNFLQESLRGKIWRFC